MINPLFVLLLLFGSAAAYAEAPCVHGFYPLWENTGRVLNEQELYLGTNQADIGMGAGVQLGAEPLPAIYRAPNVHAKIRLADRLAYQTSVYVLLPQIAERFVSPMYSSRLDNGEEALRLWNHAVSYTHSFAPWIHLHSTASAMVVLGNSTIKSELTPAGTVALELAARSHHSLTFHFGEVGAWKHDLFYYGISYRYASNWLEARAGYFYRESRDGRQAAPLVSLGLFL